MTSNISFSKNALSEYSDNVQEGDSKPKTKSAKIKTTPISKIKTDLENSLKQLNDHYVIKPNKELYDFIVTVESGMRAFDNLN